MRVFVIDDTGSSLEPLGKAAGENCDIYWIDDALYRSSETIDDFVGRILTDNVWKGTPVSAGHGACLTELVPADSVAIFVIHVHAKVTANSYRQSQDGVEVLKHIRLTEELGHLRTAHVVLCSFEDPIGLLTRKPGNLIILSKGTTVLRLPDSQRELEQRGYLAARAEIKAEISLEAFAPYVRCDFQELDSAHQFSNWWGLRQIAVARRVIKKTSNVAMPSLVETEVSKLKSKAALFLFGAKDENPTLPAEASNPPLSEGRFDIAYVDDESAWGKALSAALVEDLGPSVSVRYQPPPSSTVWADDLEIKRWIHKALVQQHNKEWPSLLLLDLRLRGNLEIDVPVPETSGARVARTVRKLHPGLPIILMTASNKAHTFEAAMKLGIDGYWMKEGIGEHAIQGRTLHNYTRLLALLRVALGPDYQFLRRFAEVVQWQKNHQSWWWENPPWKIPDSPRIDRKGIDRLLDGIVILLREYLRLFRMEYGFKQNVIERSWISALMVEADKIIERVHRVNKKDKQTKLHDLLSSRKDLWGQLLNEQRHGAAHDDDKITLDFAHAQSMLAGVITWLSVDPVARRGHLQANRSYIGVNGSNIFLR